MNSDIASILKIKILTAAHPVVDKIAGMVQTVEYAQERMNGSAEVKRIPVSIDTNVPGAAAWKERELVPNSKYRSMLYFEDGGITAGVRSAYGTEHVSKLTLICWLNTKMMAGTSTPTSDFIRDLLKIIEKPPYNSGKYLRIHTLHDAIRPMDAGVFSRYTYDQKEKQYLMPPFEYFAIGLTVKYIVSAACVVPTFTQVTPVC